MSMMLLLCFWSVVPSLIICFTAECGLLDLLNYAWDCDNTPATGDCFPLRYVLLLTAPFPFEGLRLNALGVDCPLG